MSDDILWTHLADLHSTLVLSLAGRGLISRRDSRRAASERLIDLHKLLSLLRIIGDKKGSHTWRTLIAIASQPKQAPRAATTLRRKAGLSRGCHLSWRPTRLGPNDLTLSTS